MVVFIVFFLPLALAADQSMTLSMPIPECPQELLNLLGGSEFYTIQNETIMDILCREPCPPALDTYRQSMCLKDSATGTYCTQFLEQTLGDATDPQDLLGGYTTEQLCSECVVALFAHQQSTPYSNYDVEMANAWAEIQARCGLEYPTATPTLETNVTSLGNYAPSGYATAACVGGRIHEVSSGDNCIDISKANRVSTGSLITLNSLRMDCTNLLVGQTLCLPPECDDYIFSGISYQQIFAWNPTINPYCTNLLVDHNICVGPPGGIAIFTTVPGATATQTDLYATETAARPTPVAEGTTTKCGKYYLVQPGDYCEIIALNQTINDACSNLLSGFNYCVQPTHDRAATTTSPVVPPPTPILPGTTAECYEWYVVQSGDYCGKVQDQFGITFGQFQTWNPALADDCSNLLLGVAYCVDGAVLSAPAVAAASRRTLDARAEGCVYAEGCKSERTRRGLSVPEVGGGVAIGWPGVNSPKLRQQIGLGFD
ncbi:hypothetical protein BDW67DRAFT_179034 [Aspergillus spinulosporus]